MTRLVASEYTPDSPSHTLQHSPVADPTPSAGPSHNGQGDPEAQAQADPDPALEQDAGSDDEDDTDDGGSDGESVDGLEDRFHALEEEVATLVADVHDLALYTKLNITGFMKILKVCALTFLTWGCG